MDPITLGLTAFAAAQAAVRGVQACIKLGKDVNEIASELGSFFKHATQVEKSIEEAQEKIDQGEESDQELVARCLDLKIKEKKLRDDHNRLKDMIIYELGEPTLWFDTMKMVDGIKIQRAKKKTMDIERSRKRIELKHKKNKEESQRKRERDKLLDIINRVMLWAILIIILIGGGIALLFYAKLSFAEYLIFDVFKE